MKLDILGTDEWETWEQGISTIHYQYDQTEMCYILEGEAYVTPIDGEPVRIKENDLVTFLPGLVCTWEIRRPVKKRFRIG